MNTGETPNPVYWDVDGVLVTKHHKANVPGRVSKAFPRPMPGVSDTLRTIAHDESFHNAGVATSRGRKMRGRQTPRQLRSDRHGNLAIWFDGSDSISYSDHDYARKVAQTIYAAGRVTAWHAAVAELHDGAPVLHEGLERAVLIDDSVGKVLKGIDSFAGKPGAGDMLTHFGFVAFGTDIDQVASRARAANFRNLGNNPEVVSVEGEEVLMLPGQEYQVVVVAMPQHGVDEAHRMMDTLQAAA